MVYIRYLYLFLLSAASVSLATVAEIESLLLFAFSNSSNWDDLVNTFPISGGTTNSLDDVNLASEDLNDALSLAAQFIVANGELSATDSNSILALIFMAMVPIQDALSVIADKKPSLVAIPSDFAGFLTETLIFDALGDIQDSTNELISNFNKVILLTTSLLSSIEQLELDVGRAFETALAAYSGC